MINAVIYGHLSHADSQRHEIIAYFMEIIELGHRLQAVRFVSFNSALGGQLICVRDACTLPVGRLCKSCALELNRRH